MASEQLREFAVHLGTGAVSATVSKTFIAPIERVKLLLQLQYVNEQIAAERRYKGIVDCMRRVYVEQGLWSFWRGNFANVIRYIPAQALNFALKDVYKKWFVGTTKKDQFWKFFLGNLASGGAAGATSLLVVYPLDLARTRLAADVGSSRQERMFTGSMDCIRKVYAQDGLRGLYFGFGAALWGIVIFRACYLGGYDTLKDMWLQPNSPIMLKWAVAQAVTTCVGTMVYPFDTTRRRLMMQAGRKDGKVVYKGALDCVAKIYRQEGFRGFYKGLGANILRGLGGGLLLIGYDELNLLLSKDPSAKKINIDRAVA